MQTLQVECSALSVALAMTSAALVYIGLKYGRALKVHNRAILALQEWQKMEMQRNGR